MSLGEATQSDRGFSSCVLAGNMMRHAASVRAFLTDDSGSESEGYDPYYDEDGYAREGDMDFDAYGDMGY